LYQALKAIKISDENAAIVVATLEEHIAVKISDATKSLEARLTSLTWVMGYIAVLVTIIGLAPVFSKLF
jgi:hypothetical protein